MKLNTDKEAFEKAGRDLLHQVRETEQMDRQKALRSWAGVEERLKKQEKSSSRLNIRYISAVAASVVFFVLGGFWLLNNTYGRPEMSLALLEQEPDVLFANEIVLMTHQEQMQLKGNSSIKYDAGGKTNVDEYVVTVSKKKRETTKRGEPGDWNQLVVPKGKRADVTLSDGTKVFINSDTRVVYPTVFGSDKREILVDGEVYLDVHKDASCPFIVKTKELDVKVLGTQFNVCSYGKGKIASVVLVEGSVEVTSEGGKSLLRPNQLVEIEDGKATIQHVDVSGYVCWKDGLMLLSDQEVGEVFEQLSRYYGCTIRYDAETGKIPISGELDLRTNVQEVISLICQSLFLKYEIDDQNNILISR